MWNSGATPRTGSPGTRPSTAHIPVAECIAAAWVLIDPLGTPVVPEV